MTRETIDITDEIRESEEKGIRIEYYTLDGEKPEIHMRPGDLMIICNVLHDYAKMLEEAADISIGYEQGLYRCHVDRCEKIRNKIETAMGYSTEATIEKCHKKKKVLREDPFAKESDIGEDALVLAMKQRRQKKPESAVQTEGKPAQKCEKQSGQMSIFDFKGKERKDDDTGYSNRKTKNTPEKRKENLHRDRGAGRQHQSEGNPAESDGSKGTG